VSPLLRLLAATALVALVPVVGLAEAQGERFHERSEEGWFWYEDPPAEPEPEPEVAPAPAPEPSAPVPEAEPRAATPAPAPAPGPAPLSAEWLREELDGYRDRAIDDPSPENVRTYLYLQRIAMDKATRFASAAQAATVGDPVLDATAERPIASFGAQEMDRTANRARKALLGHLAKDTGFVFFYRSDCPYCERQAPLIRRLAESTGLDVMAVALDARPMPSGAFPDFVADRGQAAALGIRTVPAFALMRPPSDVHLVGQGMTTLSELEARILLVARQAGWLSEEAWQATRPVRRTTVALAPEDLDPALLDDPARLNAFLRARMTGDAR
jgi:conjugal transfer pilus assembly protein TraF